MLPAADQERPQGNLGRPVKPGLARVQPAGGHREPSSLEPWGPGELQLQLCRTLVELGACTQINQASGGKRFPLPWSLCKRSPIRPSSLPHLTLSLFVIDLDLSYNREGFPVYFHSDFEVLIVNICILEYWEALGSLEMG